MALDKFTIKLAPTKDIAQELVESESVLATVEAEYGDFCVEGTKVTLAHHGSRSGNPAPCNTEVNPLQNGTILVSHLDLDTIGGIMALTGDKIDDPEFWKAAEFIDVNGPHHIHEFPQEVQDKLNAIWAWNANQPRVRYTELTDVTSIVAENYKMLSVVLDERHPEHDSMIQKGKEWETSTTQEVESKLVSENANLRVFKTDGVFCAGSYYSPSQECVIPATLTLNEKFKTITLAFADGGQEFSARKLVQEWWGPEAGGREGIAGSPRGQEMTEADLMKASVSLESLMTLYHIADNMNTIIKDIPNEALQNDYAIVALEKGLDNYFEKYGYNMTFHYMFNPNIELELAPTAKEYAAAIIGMEVDIEKPGEFSTTVNYRFNTCELEVLHNSCNDRDNAYETTMDTHNGQDEPIVDDSEEDIDEI